MRYLRTHRAGFPSFFNTTVWSCRWLCRSICGCYPPNSSSCRRHSHISALCSWVRWPWCPKWETYGRKKFRGWPWRSFLRLIHLEIIPNVHLSIIHGQAGAFVEFSESSIVKDSLWKEKSKKTDDLSNKNRKDQNWQ